jgi:hypothetical protein
MNIEASSIHASPVSQPDSDVPHVSAPPLDISHHVAAVLSAWQWLHHDYAGSPAGRPGPPGRRAAW